LHTLLNSVKFYVEKNGYFVNDLRSARIKEQIFVYESMLKLPLLGKKPTTMKGYIE